MQDRNLDHLFPPFAINVRAVPADDSVVYGNAKSWLEVNGLL